MKLDEKEEFWISGKGLTLLLSAVVVVWVLYGLFALYIPPNPEKGGQYGDMFGGITALFSGLAFAGLIFTLFVQKKELQYQREELSRLVNEQSQTKEHLAGQTEQMELQSRFIERQIFENNFFQLLRSFNDFISKTEITVGDSVYRANEAFEYMLNKLSRKTHSMYSPVPEGSLEFLTCYDEFYKNYNDDLGPYFRQLYNILKFVDNSSLTDKTLYSNVLRAQISDSQLALLACNIASPYGSEKMMPLVAKYNFLKHCENSELLKNKAWDTHLNDTFKDWEFFQQL